LSIEPIASYSPYIPAPALISATVTLRTVPDTGASAVAVPPPVIIGIEGEPEAFGGIINAPDAENGVKITLPDAGFGNAALPDASIAPNVVSPNAIRVTVGLVILRGAVSVSSGSGGFS
jgi:hypothetical protein